MEYKISKYLYSKEFDDCVVVCNLLSDCTFAMKRSDYNNVMAGDYKQLEKEYPNLLSAMKKLGVVIPNSQDELFQIKMMNRQTIFDDRVYRFTINPTLECNFHCWYCYEKHTKGKMPEDIIKSIENHIILKIKDKTMQYLDLSWFGGEPLLYFDDILYPLSMRLKDITCSEGIGFTNSITTNGYLIDERMINLFRDIDLNSFQITIDGDESTHDNIRFLKGHKGSFKTIIKNINDLAEDENNSVVLRINYTKETLDKINDVADLFSDKVRSRIIVNFQQVWQDSFKGNVSCEDNKDVFMQKGTTVKPFELNRKHYVCYADRFNQAVINYDGSVFKCTARDFATHTPDGKLLSNGQIQWDIPLVSKRMGQSTFENPFCANCNLLTVCMGPCSQKMIEFSEGDDFKAICLRGGVISILDKKMEEYYNNIKKQNYV